MTWLPGWRLAKLLFLACSVCLAFGAGQTITAVTFQGSAANPLIIISGAGLGSPPSPTSTALTGYTGQNYGTALHIADLTANPTAFDAGDQNPGGTPDTVGLANVYYTDV